MMNEQQHIIQKLNIEVNVPDITTARHIHDNVLSFLHQEVFPKLDKLLKDAGINEKIYRADRLSFDMKFDSEEHFSKDFIETFLLSIKKNISAVVEAQQKISNTKEEGQKENFSDEEELLYATTLPAKRWEVFVYFLRKGILPWFAANQKEWLAEEQLLLLLKEVSFEWKSAFIELIKRKEVRTRLVYQFTTSFVSQLINAVLNEELKPYLDEIEASSASSSYLKRKTVQQFLLQLLEQAAAVLSAASSSSLIIKEQLNLLVTAVVTTQKENRTEQKQLFTEEEKVFATVDEEHEDGIYVSNAGLILLHPFLEYFFKDFDLLQDKRFKSIEAQQTAVHLLYYLATGKEEPMEYELIMEKYLCGFYMYEPIERFSPLTEKMKEESDHLLNAAIHHWKVLKNTSPDGLREAFLQRNAKLITNSNRERIIIENAAIDILLEQLPWNYSLITLPWLQKIVYAEWLPN